MINTTSHRWKGEDFSLLEGDINLSSFQLEVYPFNPSGKASGDDALVLGYDIVKVTNLYVFDKETFEPQVDGINYGMGACNLKSAYFDFSLVGFVARDIRELPLKLVEGYPTFKIRRHGFTGEFRLRLGGPCSQEGGGYSRRRSLYCYAVDSDHIAVTNLTYARILEFGVFKLLNSWPVLRNGGGNDFSSNNYDFTFEVDLDHRKLLTCAYMDD